MKAVSTLMKVDGNNDGQRHQSKAALMSMMMGNNDRWRWQQMRATMRDGINIDKEAVTMMGGDNKQ